MDLRGALPPVPPRHHAALTRPADIGALLRAINGYRGSFVVQCALQLAPLVFVRAGELRRAEWSEFDLAEAVWRIPAARMKMRQEHLVPLPGKPWSSCTSCSRSPVPDAMSSPARGRARGR
jgi:integrase